MKIRAIRDQMWILYDSLNSYNFCIYSGLSKISHWYR